MTGLVAKIGVKAILGSVGGKIAAGAKGVFAWLRTLSVWQLLLIAAVLFAGFQHFQLIHAHRATARAEKASTNAKANEHNAIEALKNSQANEALLRGQIADQNKRIAALAQQSANQQQAYAEARQKAAGRVADAEAVSQRAAASSRQKPPPGAPCEPSKVLKEQWQ